MRRGVNTPSTPLPSRDSGVFGTDNATITALETVAADALQKMEDEVAHAAPDTATPELLMDAPIVAHTELCAQAV